MIELEPAVAELYVRGLLAIARADRQIDTEEGKRLAAVVEARCPGVSVAELLFDRAVTTEEVFHGLGSEAPGGPFRNTAVDPLELGQMFVADALVVVHGTNGMSAVEEAALLKFAPLFGMPETELRREMAQAISSAKQ